MLIDSESTVNVWLYNYPQLHDLYIYNKHLELKKYVNLPIFSGKYLEYFDKVFSFVKKKKGKSKGKEK